MGPHRDNLRDVLWAVGIIGLIAGVLWLAGCNKASPHPSVMHNRPRGIASNDFIIEAGPDVIAGGPVSIRVGSATTTPPYRVPVH